GFTAAAASGLIAQALYPKEKTLSAEQKQLVANLVMIAGAGVGGIAGGNLTEAGSAANTARNETENNFLSKGRPAAFAEKLKACNGEPSCEQGVRKEMAKESAENIQKLKSCWDAGDSACVAAMRSQIETDGKAYAQLGVQDALAGRSYENSANWYADIIDQCGGKCGWLESALTKTGADGLGNLAYGFLGALGAGRVPKPGPGVKSAESAISESTKLPTTSISDVRAVSAEEANAPFIAEGWNAPYDSATQVRTFTTTSDITFMRVSTPNNPIGAFMVRADEIAGMTPEQIQ
ncbi:VENN motif pre-toxin domain-containing protein, partial [Dickeya fangzhongdai]|uniref:VENN motif pre-toxin domain-containing protein n=1 Tax=Dickeya fangzhongdai TaxID=1778540 RepID=UPI001AD99BEA